MSTGLIGRDGDIVRLTELVGRSPIVTVVGPGAVGKTNSAIAVAQRAAPTFPNGAAFVDLAVLDDPAMVAPEIARRLDLVNV